MAKKKKSKVSSNVTYDATAAPVPVDNDDLLNDLLAQIDEKDAAQQQEAATVLQEVQLNDQADKIERDASAKKDSRARFEARKVRHCPYSDEAAEEELVAHVQRQCSASSCCGTCGKSSNSG